MALHRLTYTEALRSSFQVLTLSKYNSIPVINLRESLQQTNK